MNKTFTRREFALTAAAAFAAALVALSLASFEERGVAPKQAVAR